MTKSKGPGKPPAFAVFGEVPDAVFFGAAGKLPTLEQTLKAVADAERASGTRIHIVDAGAACGTGHLASALLHARRSHERGRARARDAKIEFMLYLTGQRQITRALDVAGVTPKTRTVACVIEGSRAAAEGAAEALLGTLSLVRDDTVIAPTAAKARALGARGSAGTKEGWEALAIEVVAVLDVE